jgi:hypothetical protein
LAEGEQDLKSRLLSWLAEEFDVSAEQPPANLPLQWAIKVSTKGPLKIVMVVQKPSGRDVIVATVAMALHQKHKEALLAMPERERALFVSDLLRGLYSLCPDCVIAAQPSVNRLESLVVTKFVYVEELTKPLILNTMKVLANMAVYTMLHLNSRLGPLPAGPGEGYMR